MLIIIIIIIIINNKYNNEHEFYNKWLHLSSLKHHEYTASLPKNFSINNFYYKMTLILKLKAI